MDKIEAKSDQWIGTPMAQIHFKVRSFATDLIFNDTNDYSVDKESTFESFLDELSKKHKYNFFHHQCWICGGNQKPFRISDLPTKFKDLPFEEGAYVMIQMSVHGFGSHSEQGYSSNHS